MDDVRLINYYGSPYLQKYEDFFLVFEAPRRMEMKIYCNADTYVIFPQSCGCFSAIVPS